ncbi:MAG: hypothetical protein M1444_02620 [Patescibacteria group bacterium]|nr:hypothetical protein [Patescibacteria group bacterium]
MCVSLKISGNFLPKNKLAINRNRYWLPCKELTRAGVAKETEKVKRISDEPPQACPARNKSPCLENKENDFSPLPRTILRLFGITTIKNPSGTKTILDQTKTVKKLVCKYASLRNRYDPAKRSAERTIYTVSRRVIFPRHSKIVKRIRPSINTKIAAISMLVTLFVKIAAIRRNIGISVPLTGITLVTSPSFKARYIKTKPDVQTIVDIEARRKTNKLGKTVNGIRTRITRLAKLR